MKEDPKTRRYYFFFRPLPSIFRKKDPPPFPESGPSVKFSSYFYPAMHIVQSHYTTYSSEGYGILKRQ